MLFDLFRTASTVATGGNGGHRHWHGAGHGKGWATIVGAGPCTPTKIRQRPFKQIQRHGAQGGCHPGREC